LDFGQTPNIFFKIAERLFESRGELVKLSRSPQICFACFYLSVGGNILKYYWRVFKCDFLDVPVPYLFITSPYVFTLTAWKISIETAHQKLILKMLKRTEVLV
jgi:hypothetical protein